MTINTDYTNNTTEINKKENSSSNSNEFSNYLESNKEQNDTQEISKTSSTQELIDDIMSLLRTGLTIAELEYIQNLLEEIKKKLDEASKNSKKDYDKEIKALFQTLETEILKLKKRINGEAIINVSNDIKVQNKDISFDSYDKFKNKIEHIQEDINDLQNAIAKKSLSKYNNDELKLVQDLKRL